MTPIAPIYLFAILASGVGMAQSLRTSPLGAATARPEPAVEPAPAQPVPGRQIHEPAARPADPFAGELARAKETEARWLALHEPLMEDLENLLPCGEQTPQRITEARDAAFETFTLRSNYLQKHAEHAASVLRSAQEGQTNLAVDRGELEAGSQQIAQELESARRRKAELSSSLAAAARPGDEAESLHVLDRLIVKLEQELRLTQDTLREFDQSRDRLRAITRWARERQRLAREQLDLIKAESRLWKAFYEGLNLRLELRCYESRPPIQQFPPRSPREVRP